MMGDILRLLIASLSALRWIWIRALDLPAPGRKDAARRASGGPVSAERSELLAEIRRMTAVLEIERPAFDKHPDRRR